MSFESHLNEIKTEKILRSLLNNLDGDDVILPNGVYLDSTTISLQYVNLISIDFNTDNRTCSINLKHPYILSDKNITTKEKDYVLKVMNFFHRHKDKIVELLSDDEAL